MNKDKPQVTEHESRRRAADRYRAAGKHERADAILYKTNICNAIRWNGEHCLARPVPGKKRCNSTAE